MPQEAQMNGAVPRGLEGTWAPIAASVSGKDLLVAELRVKYLVLDGHDYNIVDRSNQVVDRGEYRVNDRARPWTIDIVGRDGPNAGRSMLAMFELTDDRLTVCYHLDGGARPGDLLPLGEQMLLSITYERASSLLS